MKRLFAILLVAILATSMAFATNNVATGTGTVNSNVVIALTCTGNQVTLPNIGVGDINTNHVAAWDLVYTVKGDPTMTFDITAGPTLTGIVKTPTTGTAPTLTVATTPTETGRVPSLAGVTLTYPITQIDATSATVGTYVYSYDVSVSYHY